MTTLKSDAEEKKNTPFFSHETVFLHLNLERNI